MDRLRSRKGSSYVRREAQRNQTTRCPSSEDGETPHGHEPVNKKAPKQARFFSTKRKRQKKDESKTLTKPSKTVRTMYKNAMLNSGFDSSDDDFVVSLPTINSAEANIEHSY